MAAVDHAAIAVVERQGDLGRIDTVEQHDLDELVDIGRRVVVVEFVDPQVGRHVSFTVVGDAVAIVILLRAVGELTDIADAIAIAVRLIRVGQIDAVVELVGYAVSVGVDGGGAGAQRFTIDSQAR